eukprot:TRINITY_DN9782_c0_g1_i1.p1 TRINITY_DN9782_c0_g1~~TRINITY_DN9782_c0_g1_i1.p1  ORF type:complete len:175 (-),score=32.60 TRINITY_DN9782_c0_g1_i1:133-657(-)
MHLTLPGRSSRFYLLPEAMTKALACVVVICGATSLGSAFVPTAGNSARPQVRELPQAAQQFKELQFAESEEATLGSFHSLCIGTILGFMVAVTNMAPASAFYEAGGAQKDLVLSEVEATRFNSGKTFNERARDRVEYRKQLHRQKDYDSMPIKTGRFGNRCAASVSETTCKPMQ